LERAAASGLLVPRTLITADPDQASEFVSEMGAAALKPFGNGGFSDEAGYRIAYARRVTAPHVRDTSIRLTAHQLQEWVDADFAVRMIMIDRSVFAAAILTGSAKARIDWRSDYDALAYKRVDPPAQVYDGIQLLHSELGLRFSASDFLVDREGAWWFLETIPNGQWAWIESLTDEISRAIATALSEGANP
jgi:glutathione synthase/RimK-type ligase-like ATP-grasp enzyme